MIRGLRLGVVAIAGVVVAIYFAIMGFLVWHERQFVFIPDQVAVGDVPPGFQARMIDVPGSGKVLTWSLPASSPDKPVFVFFTGNAARIVDFVATGKAFNQQGWGVVLASYRGYSGNAGAPSEDGLMADARAVLASLPRHGRLILWGHSLGSGVAARMASEHRGDALVLESAYTSVPDVAARRYWFFPVHWLMRDRFETENLVSKIQMPVLIIHGTDDPVIPFDMGETLARDFGARGTFVPIDGVGHIPHQMDLEPIVAKWLAKNGLDR